MKYRYFFTIPLLIFLMFSSNSVISAENQPASDQPGVPSYIKNDKVASTPAEDALVVDSLKSKIAGSKVLSPLNINVTSQNGTVFIKGIVNSDSEATLLIELAQSVIGVSDVDTSELTIKKSTQPFTDMATTAKIKGLFFREKLFGTREISAINISVETRNGVVYLTGNVKNPQEIDNAIAIIKDNITGIKRVEYRVKDFIPYNQSNTTQ